MKRELLAAMALMGVLAVPVRAQEPARTGSQGGGTVQGTSSYRYMTARPQLGFSVNTRGAASDTLGARVESVTPGSPAFRAGIRTGDVITHVNGKALVASAPPGIRTVSPGFRLLEFAAQLNPRAVGEPGGADGIHKVVLAFTSFMETTKERLDDRDLARRPGAAASNAPAAPGADPETLAVAVAVTAQSSD